MHPGGLGVASDDEVSERGSNSGESGGGNIDQLETLMANGGVGAHAVVGERPSRVAALLSRMRAGRRSGAEDALRADDGADASAPEDEWDLVAGSFLATPPASPGGAADGPYLPRQWYDSGDDDSDNPSDVGGWSDLEAEMKEEAQPVEVPSASGGPNKGGRPHAVYGGEAAKQLRATRLAAAKQSIDIDAFPLSLTSMRIPELNA